MFWTKWPPCSGKRRCYPPVRIAMMFHTLSGNDYQLEYSGDFRVECFIIWHHLVVESHVHHAQSCVFPRKHERMWQTTEVSSKINNLASNGHVPHAYCTYIYFSKVLCFRDSPRLRTVKPWSSLSVHVLYWFASSWYSSPCEAHMSCHKVRDRTDFQFSFFWLRLIFQVTYSERTWSQILSSVISWKPGSLESLLSPVLTHFHPYCILTPEIRV